MHYPFQEPHLFHGDSTEPPAVARRSTDPGDVRARVLHGSDVGSRQLAGNRHQQTLGAPGCDPIREDRQRDERGQSWPMLVSGVEKNSGEPFGGGDRQDRSRRQTAGALVVCIGDGDDALSAGAAYGTPDQCRSPPVVVDAGQADLDRVHAGADERLRQPLH
jgi:hypothetical protein